MDKKSPLKCTDHWANKYRKKHRNQST